MKDSDAVLYELAMCYDPIIDIIDEAVLEAIEDCGRTSC